MTHLHPFSDIQVSKQLFLISFTGKSSLIQLVKDGNRERPMYIVRDSIRNIYRQAILNYQSSNNVGLAFLNTRQPPAPYKPDDVNKNIRG